MYVVLDSSVITVTDWHLSSPAARVLLEASRRGGVHLAVPEIVIREVTTKHREREAATIGKLENVRSSLRKLQAGFSSDDRRPVAAISDRWADDFRKRLKSALTEITPLDVVSHDELVTRALARRKPFDGEGRAGYRDALIWHAVLVLAVKDEVAFVSKDGDFGTDHGLYEKLKDDLEAHALPRERVRLYRTLEDVVRALFDPAKDLVAELNARLDADDAFKTQMLDELRRAYVRSITPLAPDFEVDLEADADEYYDWLEDYDLEDLSNFRDVEFVDAYPAADGEFSIELTVAADAVFRVKFSTQAFLHRSPRAPFDFSTDEQSFYASGFADVSLQFWSHYSRTSGAFAEHELIEIGNRLMPTES